MKKKTNGVGFWLFYALFVLLVLALLEFGKNTLAAWLIALPLLALYPAFRAKAGEGLVRFLGFVLLLAALTGVF